MKFEAIGSVSVGDLGLKIGRQVNDIDCPKWAFLWTYPTPDTQALRYECDLRLVRDLDA